MSNNTGSFIAILPKSSGLSVQQIGQALKSLEKGCFVVTELLPDSKREVAILYTNKRTGLVMYAITARLQQHPQFFSRRRVKTYAVVDETLCPEVTTEILSQNDGLMCLRVEDKTLICAIQNKMGREELLSILDTMTNKHGFSYTLCHTRHLQQ